MLGEKTYCSWAKEFHKGSTSQGNWAVVENAEGKQ